MAIINKSSFCCAVSVALLSGCSTLTSNQHPSNYQNQINPVMTEYSQALSCVGKLADNSDKPALTVYVRDIEDETVPKRFRDRRLSKGGAWWFHTAIDKMQSERVRSTTSMPGSKQRKKGNYLILSGAWTQDDQSIGVNRKSVGFNNLGSGIIDRLGWSSNQQTSVIAGDFISSVNNQVVHASAISLTVNESNQDVALRIDDGDQRLDLGLVDVVNEGPQFAQRRIAEAAALVHVAAAFELDYRACVQQNWSDPAHYQAQMQAYMAASESQQAEWMQQALLSAGYYRGKIDGVWGQESSRALSAFLLDQNLAPNGQPSADLYGLLLAHVESTPE